MKWSEHKKKWINQGVFLGVILAACVALFYGCRAEGATVTLAWDPNTEPDIAGYKIYYGSPPGTYTNVVNPGNVTNTTITDLEAPFTYAFYATCYNTSGLESEPSNVVQYTVPNPEPPAPPQNVRIE
jgi:chitinase